MSEEIPESPTLKFKVDTFLGDDGEVGIRRRAVRVLRKFGATDEWLDSRFLISAWFERRFDNDPTNDSRFDKFGSEKFGGDEGRYF